MSQQKIVCGGLHTIGPGDTLSGIARTVYGDYGQFRVIYEANRNKIGRNPAEVELGAVLKIPCLDDAGRPLPVNDAAQTAESAKIANPDQQAAAPKPAALVLEGPPLVRLLTAAGASPLVGDDLEDSGLMVALVRRAMAQSGAEAFRIDLINDRAAHVSPLLSDAAYDLGFPWAKPDCAIPSIEASAACTDLIYSEPFLQSKLGLYVRIGGAAEGGDLTTLDGLRVCRPLGYPVDDLVEIGVQAEEGELMRPRDVDDCFAALADGDADVVSVETIIAEEAIARLGVAAQVSERPEMAVERTLHAVSHRNNPRGPAVIDAINGGLGELRKTGEWFMTVQRHMAAHQNRIRATN